MGFTILTGIVWLAAFSLYLFLKNYNIYTLDDDTAKTIFWIIFGVIILVYAVFFGITIYRYDYANQFDGKFLGDIFIEVVIFALLGIACYLLYSNSPSDRIIFNHQNNIAQIINSKGNNDYTNNLNLALINKITKKALKQLEVLDKRKEIDSEEKKGKKRDIILFLSDAKLLSAMNLNDVDLSGVDLSGINFTNKVEGAKLSRAILSEADLRRANLSGADLSEAVLCSVKLQKAIYTDATQFPEKDCKPDLQQMYRIAPGSNLTGADLEKADLSGANLSKAILSKAILSKANLSKANLSGADLEEADLSGANLSKAILLKANLSGANLSGADLNGAYLIKLKKELEPSQIKSASNWDKAFYKGSLNKSEKKWVVDKKANDEYIKQLKSS